MEAHTSLEPFLRYDVREAVHGNPDTSFAAEEQSGDHEGQAVDCRLGNRCINQVRTAGLWGVGKREGKWCCWAKWTVGKSLDVRCGLRDGLGGVLGCIGLKGRLFVQVECIEFLHARVYTRLGLLHVYCAWGEMHLPSGLTRVFALLYPCSYLLRYINLRFLECPDDCSLILLLLSTISPPALLCNCRITE